jgi:hypothetical protein
VLELPSLKTGSKGRRTLELTPEVIELLQSHRALQDRERAAAGVAWKERGLIFTSPGGAPIEPSSYSHAFSAMAQRAGLGRWHVHEARHTAASLMLAMGTKLEIVSRVLGHSSVTVSRPLERQGRQTRMYTIPGQSIRASRHAEVHRCPWHSLGSHSVGRSNLAPILGSRAARPRRSRLPAEANAP